MANIPIYNLTDTWNNAGTTWDAIKMNVADSGSATASKLLDLQVGGVSKFKVLRDGDVTLTGPITGATTITMNGALSGATTIGASGTATFEQLVVTKTVDNTAVISSTDFEVTGSGTTSMVDLAGIWNTSGAPTAIKLNITESSTPAAGSLLLDLQRGTVSQFAVRRDGAAIIGGDAILLRDAANTLAQRNSTSTQKFRVYNTFTDASNHEAVELAHATYSSAQYSILRTITAGTGADNINLVLSPSGNGAITAQLPDGTATGGNARGIYAVDFQTNRESGSQSATGNYSAIIGGRRHIASGTYSGVFCGDSCEATGQSAVTLGGAGSVASGIYSIASGLNSRANKRSQIAMAGGIFSAVGDAQRSTLIARRATTDGNASELFLDGSSDRLTIPANTAWHADVRIIGRQVGGANHAIYHRKCCIERTINATALVSTVQTIGTDIETDANWDVAITADDTNDALKIEVTGVAATNIRWVAEVQLVEVAYA